MRISLFSHDSNPSVDPPILRKSEAYIEAEVLAGRVFMLNKYQAKAYPPKHQREFWDHLVSNLEDWVTRQISLLPKLNGAIQILRITTRQLATR